MPTPNLSFFKDPEHLFLLIHKHHTGIELTRFIDESALDDYPTYLAETLTDIEDIHQIAVHGPFSTVDSASSDLKVINYTWNLYAKLYLLAQELKASHVIVHGFFGEMNYSYED